jgi:hypothetical protein
VYYSSVVLCGAVNNIQYSPFKYEIQNIWKIPMKGSLRITKRPIKKSKLPVQGANICFFPYIFLAGQQPIRGVLPFIILYLNYLYAQLCKRC